MDIIILFLRSNIFSLKKNKKKLDKFFFNYLYVCVCVYVSFPKRELFERAGDDDVKHDKLYIYVLIVIMVIMV